MSGREYERRVRKAEQLCAVLHEHGITSDVIPAMPAAMWSLAIALVSQNYRGGRPVGPPSTACQEMTASMLRRRERRDPELHDPPKNPLQGLPQ